MRRLSALTSILFLAACGTTPSPPASTPTASPAAPIPTIATPTPAATASASVAPSPAAVADFTTVATLTKGDWRSGELFLFSGFRRGIRSEVVDDFTSETCKPRREELPDLATDGVECQLATGPAERVGAYLFPNDTAARAAYEVRLREHGLGWDDDGGCPFGSITPSVAAAHQPRAACFVNASGFANLRIYWPGQSVVIGVLGRNGSIRELAAWSSMLPAGQEASDVPDPWLGGIGVPAPFEACVGVPAVSRVHASTSLTFEDVGGNGGIWITDASGDETRRLPTHADGMSHMSTWAPDGRTLAYAVNRGRGGEIWLADPDGGTERRLATTRTIGVDDEDGEAPELSWSPDGRRLAYTQWRNLSGETDPRYVASAWVVDIGSADKERISDGVFVGWSPDSTRALVRLPGPPLEYPRQTKGPIVLHDLDTGTQALLGQGTDAAWSADCRFVTLTAGSRQPGLVVLSGVATRPRLVLDGIAGRWSPASDDLAVATDDGAVWRVSLETGETLRLGSGAEPAWSDDGSRLAYVSSDKGEGLVTIKADGSARRVVASDKYPMGRLAWSPDGRFIASSHEFIAETCGGPKWGFIVAADGSGVRTLPSPYHVAWRPTDPSPAGDLTADAPPKRSEGCGR